MPKTEKTIVPVNKIIESVFLREVDFIKRIREKLLVVNNNIKKGVINSFIVMFVAIRHSKATPRKMR